MTTPKELETKFWKALKSDMTMMVGISGVAESHARPMTAQLRRDEAARSGSSPRRTPNWCSSLAAMRALSRPSLQKVTICLPLYTERCVSIPTRQWWIGSGINMSQPGSKAARTDPKLTLAAARSRCGPDLGRCVELVRGHQDHARDGSEGRLQRQGRQGESALAVHVAKYSGRSRSAIRPGCVGVHADQLLCFCA